MRVRAHAHWRCLHVRLVPLHDHRKWCRQSVSARRKRNRHHQRQHGGILLEGPRCKPRLHRRGELVRWEEEFVRAQTLQMCCERVGPREDVCGQLARHNGKLTVRRLKLLPPRAAPVDVVEDGVEIGKLRQQLREMVVEVLCMRGHQSASERYLFECKGRCIRADKDWCDAGRKDVSELQKRVLDLEVVAVCRVEQHASVVEPRHAAAHFIRHSPFVVQAVAQPSLEGVLEVIFPRKLSSVMVLSLSFGHRRFHPLFILRQIQFPAQESAEGVDGTLLVLQLHAVGHVTVVLSLHVCALERFLDVLRHRVPCVGHKTDDGFSDLLSRPRRCSLRRGLHEVRLSFRQLHV
mmetsp:Transcript_63215/g.148883  ORF Transcript_63215/g.148883 Transcript_63215/m.148883 type:complete len:349 (-) Transcript_63215:353-1399(-)